MDPPSVEHDREPVSSGGPVGDGSVSRAKRTKALLVGVVLAAILNFSIPLLMGLVRGNNFFPSYSFLLLLFTAFSALAGQMCLLAIWAVLSPQPILIRTLFSVGTLVMLCGVFVVGTAYTDGRLDRPFRVFSELGTRLPLLFLAVQLPLWGLRVVLPCRVVFPDDGQPTARTNSRQFGIQHLLGTTAVVALALGLARLHWSLAWPGDWPAILITCGVFITYSTLTALPCLWLALVYRHAGFSTCLIMIYAVVMSVAMIGVISLFNERPPNVVDYKEVTLILLFHSGLLAVVFGGLLVVRACGGRLVRCLPNARWQKKMGN